MKKLNEFLDFLTDYEMNVIKEILKYPENKERAEKESPDELAHTILITLSWHYKGLWDGSEIPYDIGERSEQLWKKARELGIAE